VTPIGANSKQALAIAGLILVILASLTWIYVTEVAAPKINLPLHQGVGLVLAEETSKVLGNKGQVVIIAINSRKFPELKAQLGAFEKALKGLGGIKVKETYMVETNDDPKYGVGTGLSAKHFLKIRKKYADADAIVSFVGVPNMTDEDFTGLKKTPKFIAETRSPEKSVKLFQKGVLQVAIISRFVFPAPGPKNPHTPREWFDQYFQIVTAASLPPLDASSSDTTTER